MFTPLDSPSGMYFNLLEKTFQKLKTASAGGSVAALVQKKFEDSLKTENIVLIPSEKKRLFNQVFRMLLEDMLSEINKDQNQ